MSPLGDMLGFEERKVTYAYFSLRLLGLSHPCWLPEERLENVDRGW